MSGEAHQSNVQVTVRDESREAVHHHGNQVRCQFVPVDLYDAVKTCECGKSEVSVVLP